MIFFIRFEAKIYLARQSTRHNNNDKINNSPNYQYNNHVSFTLYRLYHKLKTKNRQQKQFRLRI